MCHRCASPSHTATKGMQRRIAPSMPRAGARKRLVGAPCALGLGLAVLLALNPGSALAQVWAQAAPVAPTPASSELPASLPSRPAVARQPRMADFQQESASEEVRHVAHWVVDSADNGGMPYVIVDKVNARVFVFDAGGHLQGTQPALLGMVQGDGSAQGIGDQKLSAMRPEDRTTPAGRYVASLGLDQQGQDILWIDYASALALHRVVKGKPSERRSERLQSSTSADNRISYGCINVPVATFEKVVSPAFSSTSGIVYILPESAAARELFGSYDVVADTQSRAAAQ